MQVGNLEKKRGKQQRKKKKNENPDRGAAKTDPGKKFLGGKRGSENRRRCANATKKDLKQDDSHGAVHSGPNKKLGR